MAIHARKRKCDGITVYLIDFTDQNGARRREVAGTTIKQARVKLAQRIGEVRAGTYQPKRDAKRAAEAGLGPSFADFGERFLRDYAATRRSYFYAQRVALLGAREPFKSKRIGELTRSDLQAYCARRMETSDGWRKAKGATVRRELAVLRVMFKCAVRWGVLASNPCEGIELPRESPHKTRWLDREESAACSTLPIRGSNRFSRLPRRPAHGSGSSGAALVGYRPGKRTREHPGRKDDGTPGAADGGTRGDAGRDPAPAPLRLRVFDGDRGAADNRKARTRISSATRDAAKRAKLRGVSLHTVRHSTASWLVQAGIPLYEVQTILGHSTPTMTMRYAHLAPGFLAGASAALDAELGGQNANGNDTPVDTRGGSDARKLGGRKGKC